MNELEKLKPEVREALEDIDDCMRMDIKVVPVGALGVIRAELVRLARDNEALRSKCNVIMSGSTQHLGRAERAESELAALKRRIAESVIWDSGYFVQTGSGGTELVGGKRYRLLLDE